MPGDPLKKVQPGQRLQIPAEAFNAFLDASRYVRARQHSNESESGEEFRQTGIVKVRNITSQDQQRYSVLALQDPIIGPADNLREFKNRVNFDGDVPEDPPRGGRYAVLLEPLARDAIGRGIVAGVTPVRLRVNPDQLYDFAEVQAGETGALRNVPHGSARVLWVEDTGSTERWAVVRLDDGDYQAHVLITSNVPDDDGYYPGFVQRYDVDTNNVDTKSWESGRTCIPIELASSVAIVVIGFKNSAKDCQEGARMPDKETIACAPVLVQPDRFNPSAVIPHGLRSDHIRKAMEDFIDFLGFINTQLRTKRIQRLESFLMPANFSSMVAEFMAAAIPKYCKTVIKNRYHNGHPDLLPNGHYRDNSVLHGQEGIELKASRHPSGWQGHNPEDVWLMVFVFDANSSRDEAQGIEPKPFQFVKVVGAKLEKSDWQFSGRSSTSRRTITASVKRSGFEKMEANWIYRVSE